MQKWHGEDVTLALMLPSRRSGEPRHGIARHWWKTSVLSVDWLGLQPFIDRKPYRCDWHLRKRRVLVCAVSRPRIKVLANREHV